MRLIRAGITTAALPLAAWLGAALAPRPAAACSCLATEAAASIEAADVVFEGTVVGPAEPTQVELWFDGYSGALRFDFEVARYFKGQLGASVPIFTINQGTACGRHYAEGDSYLIYAHYQEDGLLTDSSCSRSRLMTRAADDVALLGSGVPPDVALDAPAVTDVEAPSLSSSDGSDLGAARAGGCTLSSGSGSIGRFAASTASAFAALSLLLVRRRSWLSKQTSPRR